MKVASVVINDKAGFVKATVVGITYTCLCIYMLYICVCLCAYVAGSLY